MKSVESRYTKIFGAYDIRGIVGEDLDSAIVRAIAGAYGDYLCPDQEGRFVVGHDGRWSSPALAEAASVGLRESGHNVTHMGLAGALGVFAVIRSFGMFYLGLNIFHLGTDQLRTLIYLSLSVGGILTLINARTRGPFWSIMPGRALLIATTGAMLAATFISVYGALMAPLGWRLAGIVWGYSVGMFLIQDRVKLLGYKILGKEHSGYFGRHVREKG
jgi:hypothetical protein